MKKLTMLLGLLTVLTIVSCREKKDPPPPPPQAEATPAESVPAESNEEADGTSVNVGTDGVDIQTKDGKKETKVTIEGGEANIEIKK